MMITNICAMRVSCTTMLHDQLQFVFAYLCSDGIGMMITRRLR